MAVGCFRGWISTHCRQLHKRKGAHHDLLKDQNTPYAMGPRSHPPRSLTLPSAPQRVHWLSLALPGARRKVPTRSMALSRARSAPWRSLAFSGAPGGALGTSPPPGTTHPYPPPPGSLRGDYRGAFPPTTTPREIEAKAKANAKREKGGSERERRKSGSESEAKKRKRKRRREDLSHTPNRSADLRCRPAVFC